MVQNTKVKSLYVGILEYSVFLPNLGCYGDGGCVVTNKKKYFLKIKKIANHGGLKKNKHEVLGRNSRLDNISGHFKIKLKVNKWISLRNEQAKIYYRLLSKIKKFH